MEITKAVPVTIVVNDEDPTCCGCGCIFNYDDDLCEKYNQPIQSRRNPECLADFDTGEKENG
jgi:hypothetical protein